MIRPRSLQRFACAVFIGAGSAVACVGSAIGETIPVASLPMAAPVDATPDGGPRCPYGALEDPHRGFVRCLQPDERDAGWLPPPPQGEAPPEPPSDAGVEPPPPPPNPAGALPRVEVGPPKFENGEVTKVEKSLNRAARDLARCVADHGGLTGDVASVKLQFLVRARGRAEGVEVLTAKNVSAEAAGCVRHTVKNRAIGAPSADPVGVTVVLTFRGTK